MTKITFLGDFICHRPFLKAALKRGRDFDTALAGLRPLLAEADFSVGTLETPVADESLGLTSSFFRFNTPKEFPRAIKDAGLSLVTTANNHCFDRGIKGLTGTLDTLDALGLPHSGTYRSLEEQKQNKFHLAEIGGTKISFLCYNAPINGTPLAEVRDQYQPWMINQLIDPVAYQNHIDVAGRKKVLLYDLRQFMLHHLPLDWTVGLQKKLGRKFKATTDAQVPESLYAKELASLKDTILEARQQADLVFLVSHCGGQYNQIPGPFSETIYSLAAQAGADAIIGGHPHCIQSFRLLGKTPCLFSLGNVTTSVSLPFIDTTSRPEYGLALHVYLASKAISKITCTFLKATDAPDRYPIVQTALEAHAQARSAEAKAKIVEDLKALFARLTGQDIPFPGLRQEYTLYGTEA